QEEGHTEAQWQQRMHDEAAEEERRHPVEALAFLDAVAPGDQEEQAALHRERQELRQGQVARRPGGEGFSERLLLYAVRRGKNGVHRGARGGCSRDGARVAPPGIPRDEARSRRAHPVLQSLLTKNANSRCREVQNVNRCLLRWMSISDVYCGYGCLEYLV